MENTHQCNECNTPFKYRRSLLDHMNVHTGDKPYQCSHCDKTFLYEIQRTAHMMSHTEYTDNKRYQCSECDEGFLNRYRLEAHKRTHSGEGPFKCIQCDKSFSEKQYLQTHIRIHSGEISFQCYKCKIYLSNKSNLNRHMEIHNKKSQYKGLCGRCNFFFYYKTDFKNHIRSCTPKRTNQYIPDDLSLLLNETNTEGIDEEIRNNVTNMENWSEIKNEAKENVLDGENSDISILPKLEIEIKEKNMDYGLQTEIGMEDGIFNNNNINNMDHLSEITDGIKEKVTSSKNSDIDNLSELKSEIKEEEIDTVLFTESIKEEETVSNINKIHHLNDVKIEVKEEVINIYYSDIDKLTELKGHM